VITAAGGYHHVLADDDRLLVEGYYPEARPLRAAEARELRAAWAFGARYVHLLSDPAARPADVGRISLVDADGRPIPVSATPEAGAVWVRATTTPTGRVVQLVDLTAQQSDRWDDVRQPSPDRSGWVLRWDGGPERLVAATPWHGRGAAAAVQRSASGARALPSFRRWLLIAACG
jgi:hypothetical protein